VAEEGWLVSWIRAGVEENGSVACRPRFGGVYTTAGMDQLERFSRTGTSYSDETGTRPTEFSFVCKYQLAT
jgi:hypothetical protein